MKDSSRDSTKFIKRFRGDSRSVEITVFDSEGNAVDVASYTGATLTVNSLLNPPDISTQLFESTGDTVTDGINGVITFPITTTDTDQTPGTYFYDIELIDADGEVDTIIKSKFVIKQDISK